MTGVVFLTRLGPESAMRRDFEREAHNPILLYRILSVDRYANPNKHMLRENFNKSDTKIPRSVMRTTQTNYIIDN